MIMWIVYKHTCVISGKSYIGCTSKSCEDRWLEHVASSIRGSELAFHRALRKYPLDSWQHETLATYDAREIAFLEEARLIAEHRTFPDGYNMTAGGEGSTCHSYTHTAGAKERIRLASIGRKVSSETRSKISLANKGKIRTLAQRMKISEAHKCQSVSDETRQKLSAVLSGRVLSEEHRAKIGLAHRGRKHTESSRKNMSNARRGQIQTEEAKRKRSESLTGHAVTEATRQKIREKRLGKTMSEEARKKMSEKAKARWELKRIEQSQSSIQLNDDDLGSPL